MTSWELATATFWLKKNGGQGFPGGLAVKNPSANAGNTGSVSSGKVPQAGEQWSLCAPTTEAPHWTHHYLACYPCFPGQRPRVALRKDSHSWHKIEGAGAKAGRLISYSTTLRKLHLTKQPSSRFNNAQSLLGKICIKQRHIRSK